MGRARRNGEPKAGVISKVGVIVPAHNEEESIVECVQAIRRATASLAVIGIDSIVIVVCDACSDATARLVQEMGLIPVHTDGRNVGSARAAGSEVALATGADWLAFTDADTIVAPDWLVDQLAVRADAVCGTIGVLDWGTYGQRMHEHFSRTYSDVDGHRHIHGANFGISAHAYRHVGGFQSLESSEDVALVDALLAADLRITWSSKPRVWTSARQSYRAPNGFGATLERVAHAFCDSVATAGVNHSALPDSTTTVAA